MIVNMSRENLESGERAVSTIGSFHSKGESRTDWPGKPSTYYGAPLLKKAHWGWQIILYFFLGGLAGGSYLVASLADISGRGQMQWLIRAGRYLSFLCILLCPILLIWDLGRPERFLHMLRVFKLRSVMSLGTWGITFFGLCCGLTTARQMAEDGFLSRFPWMERLLKALPIKIIEVFGSVSGLCVASYTGVLLSSTAVPLWGRAKHLLGPLFVTSGLSTALASLSCLLALRCRKQQRCQGELEGLERAEIVTMVTELGLISTLVPTLGPLGKPLFTGRTGRLFKIGVIGGGLILPLLLHLGWKYTGRSAPRGVQVSASLLTLLGGLILRYVWIVGGRASADNPEAVHYYNALEGMEQDVH